MSRAFVKELEDVDVPLPEPVGERPITPLGKAELEARLAEEHDPQARAEVERILAHVIVVAAPERRERVAFGATVRVAGMSGAAERTFTIVGEDEIDVEHGRIGESSPLAQALLGKKAGASAVWRRPVGDLRLVVRGVSFERE